MDIRTVEQHIASIRTLIKQTSDDTKYSDEFLFKEFLEQRAILLTQKLNDFKYMSKHNYRPFYMPLEKDEVLDIPQVPEGLMCRHRKSMFKVPRSISSKVRDTLKVMTIEGQELDTGDAIAAKLAAHSYTRANRPMWDIVGDYLIIYNKLDLPGVIVDAIWVDPTDIGVLPQYDAATETYSIDYDYDPYTDTVPMDEQLSSIVYEMVMKRMGISFQMPEDNANNAQSNTTNQNQVK